MLEVRESMSVMLQSPIHRCIQSNKYIYVLGVSQIPTELTHLILFDVKGHDVVCKLFDFGDVSMVRSLVLGPNGRSEVLLFFILFLLPSRVVCT